MQRIGGLFLFTCFFYRNFDRHKRVNCYIKEKKSQKGFSKPILQLLDSL